MSLQKGKHSVIDLETSEPSDIKSVETDTTTEEDGFMDQIGNFTPKSLNETDRDQSLEDVTNMKNNP